MSLKCLVSEGLIKFGKLLGTDGYLETHSKIIYHTNAIQGGKTFLNNNYCNSQNEVVNKLNTVRHQQALKNSVGLKPVTDVLAFLR